MMNNYLFETCRGEFNWNKLMSKSVHLVGNSHVYIYIYIYHNARFRECKVPSHVYWTVHHVDT